MNKRTAREITVSDGYLLNKNINVKIGAVENKHHPHTVYINIMFWISLKNILEAEEVLYYKKKLSNFLNKIINKNFIEENITNNEYFVYEKDNIYLIDIPKNFYYNQKPSFISMELYLNTININGGNIPLDKKNDYRLFNECIKITNLVGEKLKELEEKGFVIKKTFKKTPI